MHCYCSIISNITLTLCDNIYIVFIYNYIYIILYLLFQTILIIIKIKWDLHFHVVYLIDQRE